MVDLKKELDKIKEKQDKVNYLQELLKVTKDIELKDQIYHLLDQLLDEDTLDEVVEPVRIQHPILEEVRREIPEEQPQRVEAAPREEQPEEIVKHDIHVPEYETNIRELSAGLRKSEPKEHVEYVPMQTRETQAEYIPRDQQQKETPIAPPIIRDVEREINQFSAENLFKKREDRRSLKMRRERR